MGPHLNKHDVAHLPYHLCHPHGFTHSVTWHWKVVGVVVLVCCEGCGQLIIPVGIDGGGGGWNETVVCDGYAMSH